MNPLGPVVNPPRLQPGVGLRGIILVLCAYVWALIGLDVWMNAAPEADSAFHLAIPGHWRALMWWISTVAAIVFAWRPRSSWVALGILIIMPVIHIFFYGWAWIVYLIPGPPPGYPTGWYTVAFHLGLVAVVVIAAFIPDGLTVHDLRQIVASRRAKEEADE